MPEEPTLHSKTQRVLHKSSSRLFALLLALVVSAVGLVGCGGPGSIDGGFSDSHPGYVHDSGSLAGVSDLAQIPDYAGSPYVVVANNYPAMDESDAVGLTERYSPLDYLGRCGVAMAVVSPTTMPTDERESIGQVKPSGWHTIRYDDLVEGNYLYNRCHLLGYQLTGENANEENLITGTRYLNVEGMLPFENEIADYVERTDGSVLVRSTPVFVGNELVARGVQLEALSLGDGGAGVRFNVFCFNVQPGIEIDYNTGASWRSSNTADTTADAEAKEYVINERSDTFHLPDCSSVAQMSETNKLTVTTARTSLIDQGYAPCGRCQP